MYSINFSAPFQKKTRKPSSVSLVSADLWCVCAVKTSVFLENLVSDLNAGGADTKRCSFSLCQLIETNPVLTPSSGISANLLLMTGRGGGVDGEERRWGAGVSLEQHLVCEVLQPIPFSYSVSAPHDWEDVSINPTIWWYAAHIRLRSHCHLACSTLGGVRGSW